MACALWCLRMAKHECKINISFKAFIKLFKKKYIQLHWCVCEYCFLIKSNWGMGCSEMWRKPKRVVLFFLSVAALWWRDKLKVKYRNTALLKDAIILDRNLSPWRPEGFQNKAKWPQNRLVSVFLYPTITAFTTRKCPGCGQYYCLSNSQLQSKCYPFVTLSFSYFNFYKCKYYTLLSAWPPAHNNKGFRSN